MAQRRLLPVMLVLIAVVAFTAGYRSGTARQAAVLPARPAAPPATMDPQACRPPVQHPDPVVLVHGTFATTSWGLIGPALARGGYCVFTFDYGNRARATSGSRPRSWPPSWTVCSQGRTPSASRSSATPRAG